MGKTYKKNKQYNDTLRRVYWQGTGESFKQRYSVHHTLNLQCMKNWPGKGKTKVKEGRKHLEERSNYPN